MSPRILLFLVLLCGALSAAWAATAASLGFTLKALSDDDLDTIEANIGYRVGVLVERVAPNSAAAKAGFKDGDVLFAFGKDGVDSPAAVDKALAGKTGTLEVIGLRWVTEEETASFKLTLTLAATSTSTPVDPTPTGAKGVYADPQGRFTITQPAGWAAQAFPNGQGVTLTKGQAAITVMLSENPDNALALLNSVHGQIVKQTKNYKKLGQSARTVAGAACTVVDFSGINPQGVQARSRITALVKGDTGYVFILSLPEKDFNAGLPAWDAVLDSFSTAKAAPEATGARTTQTLGSTPGQTYRHPVGFTFWYPKGWTLQDRAEGLVLTPPNAGSNAQGATELYLVTGDSLAGTGITAADDPRITAFLDQKIAEMLPMLRRTKAGVPIETTVGKGTMLEWEGQGGNGPILGRAYVAIVQDYGVALVALGLKDKVLARSADLKTTFGSFGFSEGKRDPALVGSWHLLTTFSLSNEGGYRAGYVTQYEKASSVSDVNTTVTLRPDGTAIKTEISRTIAGGSGVWIDSGDQKETKQGRWNADGGALYILWQDNAADYYKYAIGNTAQGRVLQLTSGKQGQNWRQVQ